MSDQYIGYIKYRGKLVEDGMMDARKQAEALLCADSAIRSFLSQQSPDIKKFDFEIPVKIRRGSWELLIPENVGQWAQAGLAIVATAYFSKAAQKMAENDFSEVGVKDLFLKSIDSLKWFVRIGKHLGSVSLKKFENPKFTDNNSIIGIPNSQGEYLYIPKNIFDSYINSEPMVLDKLAQFIETDRELVIATIDEEGIDEEAINKEQKGIFCSSENEEEEELLFPELEHGDSVVLEGEVTRENKTSNSMGFKYMDHILTSYPETGSIVQYKLLIFSRCRIFARVDRRDDKGSHCSKRPKLYFSHMESLEPEAGDLFSQENNT